MTVCRFFALWLAAVWTCPLSAASTTLRIAVVPIVNQGHFLDEMLAGFAAREQVTLRIDAQHGRKAVAAVRARAVDLVITHADFNGMAALVHAGDVQASEVVFANPIALLGPAADPAGIATTRTPEEALARIATTQHCVVPNDLQHLQEFTPSPPARCEAPAGTGLAAIQAAVRTHAYVWWGLHPFLLSGQPLTPTVWADPRLLRPLMAWIPAGPHAALAVRAVAELRSHEIQQRLGSFRFPTHPSLQVWWPYHALDRLAALRARGTLRVAMKNPGARAAADHRDPAHVAKRAFEMEIAAALTASILGDPARLQPITLRKPERLPAVAGGAVDLGIAMMRPTDKARLFADFSAPYYSDGLAVMHRAGDAIEHVSALSGRRLLSLARDALGQDDERAHLEALAGHAVAPKPVANFEAAAALIEAGEADALISQAANIDSFLKTSPRALVRSPILGRSEFAVAIPKDNPALKALVDAAIERLRANGSLQRWSAAAGLGSVHEGPDEHAESEEAHRHGGGGQGRGNGGGHRRDRGR